jgi:MFS transporter, FHS family, glucose/mannose:H+ symporter
VTEAVRPRILFISACAGIFVFGSVLAILGTVFGLPATRSRLGIDLAQQGNLFLLLYAGIFFASLIVGPLIDHLGNKPNLFVSSAIVGVAMFMFSVSHSLLGASAAALLLGVGGGGLNTCANVLVSDLYGDRRGPMLNLLGIFFGIGALCIPLLAANIEGHFTIPQLFLCCAFLPACCAFAYAVIPFPSASANQAFSSLEVFAVAKYEGLFLLASILFVECGNEACIGGWTSTYVNSTGKSPKIATMVLAVYWAFLMLSRLLAAQLLQRIRKSHLVTASALISLVGCVILLSGRSVLFLVAGTAIIGLSYGPIFPTILGIAGDRYAKAAGTIFGFLFSIALIGGMLFPLAFGQVSQRETVRAGMIVPCLGAVGISLLAAIVMIRERSPSHIEVR